MRNNEGKRRRPIHFGPAWSIVFLPLFFIAAGVSLPYSVVCNFFQRRREMRFQKAMECAGRVIPWGQVELELAKGDGTIVVERFSLKGPVRWWWTPENVFDLCPYPLADWSTMERDSSFEAARRWCLDRYSGPSGSALLIVGTRDERHSIVDGRKLFADHVRFLEVPPFL